MPIMQRAHAAEIIKPSHSARELNFGACLIPSGFPAKITPKAKALLQPVQAFSTFRSTLNQLSSDSPEADLDPLAKLGCLLRPVAGGRIYFKYHHTAANTLDKE